MRRKEHFLCCYHPLAQKHPATGNCCFSHSKLSLSSGSDWERCWITGQRDPGSPSYPWWSTCRTVCQSCPPQPASGTFSPPLVEGSWPLSGEPSGRASGHPGNRRRCCRWQSSSENPIKYKIELRSTTLQCTGLSTISTWSNKSVACGLKGPEMVFRLYVFFILNWNNSSSNFVN